MTEDNIKALLADATMLDSQARERRKAAGAALAQAKCRLSADAYRKQIRSLGLDERSVELLIEMHAGGKVSSDC